MIRRIILMASLLTALAAVTSSKASAIDPYAQYQIWAYNFAMERPWHGAYYNQQYGQPLALIVPPTAHMRQSLSWGVGQSMNHQIYHQFGRSANSPGAAPAGTFQATPAWPSHTDQFGVYYVRSPW